MRMVVDRPDNHEESKMQTQTTDRVLAEGFDTSRVIGKTLAELDTDTVLDWMGAYPIIEDREAVLLPGGEFRYFDGLTQVATGIVDANHPETFNGGNWEVVDDAYAVATSADEAEAA